MARGTSATSSYDSNSASDSLSPATDELWDPLPDPRQVRAQEVKGILEERHFLKGGKPLLEKFDAEYDARLGRERDSKPGITKPEAIKNIDRSFLAAWTTPTLSIYKNICPHLARAASELDARKAAFALPLNPMSVPRPQYAGPPPPRPSNPSLAANGQRRPQYPTMASAPPSSRPANYPTTTTNPSATPFRAASRPMPTPRLGFGPLPPGSVSAAPTSAPPFAGGSRPYSRPISRPSVSPNTTNQQGSSYPRSRAESAPQARSQPRVRFETPRRQTAPNEYNPPVEERLRKMSGNLAERRQTPIEDHEEKEEDDVGTGGGGWTRGNGFRNPWESPDMDQSNWTEPEIRQQAEKRRQEEIRREQEESFQQQAAQIRALEELKLKKEFEEKLREQAEEEEMQRKLDEVLAAPENAVPQRSRAPQPAINGRRGSANNLHRPDINPNSRGNPSTNSVPLALSRRPGTPGDDETLQADRVRPHRPFWREDHVLDVIPMHTEDGRTFWTDGRSQDLISVKLSVPNTRHRANEVLGRCEKADLIWQWFSTIFQQERNGLDNPSPSFRVSHPSINHINPEQPPAIRIQVLLMLKRPDRDDFLVDQGRWKDLTLNNFHWKPDNEADPFQARCLIISDARWLCPTNHGPSAGSWEVRVKIRALYYPHIF